MHTTPVTLLERLKEPSDQEAWARFVRLYTPLLFAWARQHGLQAADAADLIQEVFTTLVRKLPEFSYDPRKSFRSWLRTVTLNLWRDRCRRLAQLPDPGNGNRLEDIAADDSSLFPEGEYRRDLVDQALRIVRRDFREDTWEAFRRHALLGQPAAEVARDLNLTAAAVYCARLRVIQRLRKELTGFLD